MSRIWDSKRSDLPVDGLGCPYFIETVEYKACGHLYSLTLGTRLQSPHLTHDWLCRNHTPNTHDFPKAIVCLMLCAIILMNVSVLRPSGLTALRVEPKTFLSIELVVSTIALMW